MTADGPSTSGSVEMTRAEKVMQRTKVGGALAVAVALLLYAASLEQGPLITLGMAAALAIWSLFEVRAMGLFLSPIAFVVTVGATLAFAALLATNPATLGSWQESPFLPVAALAVPLAGIVLFKAARGEGSGGAAAPAASGPRSYSTVILLVTVALPLLALYPIRLSGGAAGLAAFIGLAKIGDIAGYYFGNLMGKRKPFPNISPGKTVAGCNASLITAILVGSLLASTGALAGPRYGLLSGAVLGAIINLLAQAGDLLESAYKRRAGVKDSGTMFGPSGGMFDLVDSLILSAPVAALAWPLLFTSAS